MKNVQSNLSYLYSKYMFTTIFCHFDNIFKLHQPFGYWTTESCCFINVLLLSWKNYLLVVWIRCYNCKVLGGNIHIRYIKTLNHWSKCMTTRRPQTLLLHLSRHKSLDLLNIRKEGRRKMNKGYKTQIKCIYSS